MTQHTTRHLTLALCFALGIATAAQADDGEREVLARLAHEIEALGALVDEAEAHANTASRVRFRYDWLRSDLAQIRAGVLEHSNAPRTQPRRVPPLQGDYRR